MHGLKSAIFAIFQKGLGWPCPVSLALKNNHSIGKKNIFMCRWISRMIGRQKSAYSFMLKYSEIKCECLPSSLVCFSDNSFTVNIRRSDQFHGDKFEASYVTPQLLQKVFELESLPEFLKTESDSRIVPIVPSALSKNGFYIIKGPGEKVHGKMETPKNRETGTS